MGNDFSDEERNILSKPQLLSNSNIIGRRPLYTASHQFLPPTEVTSVLPFCSKSPRKFTKKGHRRRMIDLSPSKKEIASTSQKQRPPLENIADKKTSKTFNTSNNVCANRCNADKYRSIKLNVDHTIDEPPDKTTNLDEKYNVSSYPCASSMHTTDQKLPLNQSMCDNNDLKIKHEDEDKQQDRVTSLKDETESDFLKTFKILRTSFKEKIPRDNKPFANFSNDEDDLIVLTKTDDNLCLSDCNIKHVVRSIVANEVSSTNHHSLKHLTIHHVVRRMNNLYHMDFSDRFDLICQYFDEAKQSCSKLGQAQEVRPGIKSHDLATLNPGEWLNDVIINNYLMLLTTEQPNSCLVSSFFYEELRRKKEPLLPIDWHNKKWMLIPVCLCSHWSLLCVSITSHTIDIYNSLESKQSEVECASIILSYLEMKCHHLHCHKTWSLMRRPDLPVQINAYDCGVYVCMFARQILFQLSSNFKPKQVTEYRNWLKCELLNNKLMR